MALAQRDYPDIKDKIFTFKSFNESNNINNIDSVIFTHNHGDQMHGINDLRIFSLKNSKKVPVYADNETTKYLIKKGDVTNTRTIKKNEYIFFITFNL